MTISIFGRGAERASPGRRKRAPGRAPAPRERPPRSEPVENLRLMSLNIAHARSRARHQSLLKDTTIRKNLELIAKVLARERPDVVALQEADGPSFWSGGFDHVAALAELAGFAHTFRGEHNRAVPGKRLDLSYGTALLSTLPLEAPRSHAFSANWRDTKGFVAATVAPAALGSEPVDVVSIHLDFLAERVRRRQVAQLVERFRGHTGHLVVMGDFNCPWSERRRSLELLMHELKLRPCRESQATYPAWRPLVRLDWILVSEGLDFASYETLSDRVSDHLGVLAEVCSRSAAAHPRDRQRAQPRRLPSVSLA